MLKVEDLTIERMQNGEFQNELPELYALKEVIENNAWHENERVFNHTMKVLYELKQIKNNSTDAIKKYLGQELDENNHWNTLYTGALFHDIAKGKTLIKQNNLTFCPGHEEMGADIITPILNRIFLSNIEQKVTTSIIRYHGCLHQIIYPKNKHLEEQYKLFMSQQSDIAVELNIIALADTLSSKPLKTNSPEEYKFRTEFYKCMLEKY